MTENMDDHEIRQEVFDALTAEQQEDHVLAVEAAKEAWVCHDLAREHARDYMRALIEDGKRRPSDPEIEDSYRLDSDEEFADAYDKYTRYMQMAKILMPGKAAYKIEEIETVPDEEAAQIIDRMNSPEDEQLLLLPGSETLSPELLEKASKLAEAMAEKFSLDPNDFRVVTINQDHATLHTVVYAAHRGIDISNHINTAASTNYRSAWNYAVTDNVEAQADFTIELDGQQYDTRKGMIEPIYRKLIHDCQLASATSGDCPDTSRVYTFSPYGTLLSGEEFISLDEVLFAGVNRERNRVYVQLVQLDDMATDEYRFRPAVKL